MCGPRIRHATCRTCTVFGSVGGACAARAAGTCVVTSTTTSRRQASRQRASERDPPSNRPNRNPFPHLPSEGAQYVESSFEAGVWLAPAPLPPPPVPLLPLPPRVLAMPCGRAGR